MRILVTGANGQLGSDLLSKLPPDYQVYGLSHQEMDVTSMYQVQNTIQQLQPDVVIHAAAYTKVDDAELNSDQAYLVNAYGTRNVTVAAQRVRAKMVYISTDYVFNGQRDTPYCEFSDTDPINVYGRSKLAGEDFVKSLSDRYFIVRTSWVYGLTGNNFVKTMLNMAQEKKELFVVDDQIGSPTYTVDLVQFLKDLIRTDYYGIYHASNSSHCSWYEFAKAIFTFANIDLKVTAVSSQQFRQTAKRPAFSSLDHMSIRLHGFQKFRHWSDALEEFITNFRFT